MPLSPDAPLLGNHPGSRRARLDDTARALGLTSRGAYWVWGKEEDDGGAIERVGDHVTRLRAFYRSIGSRDEEPTTPGFRRG